MKTQLKDITVQDMIRALDAITWYNGLAEIIAPWIESNGLIESNGWLSVDYEWLMTFDVETQAQLEVIWMICCVLFGDYGTSPRSGWIVNVPSFREFIKAITLTHREAERDEDNG